MGGIGMTLGIRWRYITIGKNRLEGLLNGEDDGALPLRLISMISCPIPVLGKMPGL